LAYSRGRNSGGTVAGNDVIYAQHARLIDMHGSKRSQYIARRLQYLPHARRALCRTARKEKRRHESNGGGFAACMVQAHQHGPLREAPEICFLPFSLSPRLEWSPAVHHSSCLHRTLRMQWGVRPVPLQPAGTYICTCIVRPYPLSECTALRKRVFPFFFSV
jgi:hypothetical protein